MALDTQNVSISFQEGIDTKADPKQLMGKLTRLENGVLTSPLQVKKRNGYAALANDIEGGTSVAVGKALSTFQSELTLFDGSTIYSRSLSTSRWSNKGFATSLKLSSYPVVRNSYAQTTPDAAYHSTGISVFTWEDSRGGARYSVYDSTTKQSIVQDVTLGSNTFRPKPIVVGNFVVIFFGDSATNKIKYTYVAVSSPSVLGTVTDFVTDLNAANANFDATAFSGQAFVAYNNQDLGGGITVKAMDATTTPLPAYVVTGESASGAVNVFGDSSNSQIWVSYYNGTAVKASALNFALSASVLAPTVVETVASVRGVCGIAASGTATLYYEISAAASYNNLIRQNTITNAGAVGAASVYLRSVGLASKPFKYGASTYLGIAYQSALQPTYFFADSLGRIVAKVSQNTGGGLTAKSCVPETVQISTDVYGFGFLQKDLLTTISGAVYSQTGVMAGQLDFASSTAYGHAELCNNLHLTGGMLAMYDGASVVEHGFHVYPENLSVSTGYVGGALAPGQYQYSALYEWKDNQGNAHRSAPSVAQTVNLNTNATAQTVIGNTTSGAGTIQGVPINIANKLAPGMLVTGNGIPGSTYVVYALNLGGGLCGVVITNNVTVTQTGAQFTFAPQSVFSVTLTLGSPTVTTIDGSFMGAGGASQPAYYGDYVQGSNQWVVRNSAGLVAGQTLIQQTQSTTSPWASGVGATILAISGNTVTLDTTPLFTASNIVTRVATSASGVSVNGSPVITGINATQIAFFYVGQLVSGTNSPGHTTVSAVGASSITLSANASSSGACTITPDAPSNFAIYSIGQAVSGTGIPANTTITGITASTLTLSNTATASGTAVMMTSVSLYINSITVPTLRLTAKTKSPVTIKLFRTQGNLTNFYLISSVTAPTFNDTTIDSVTFTDGTPDASIIGNEILYTTGGVVENIAPPAPMQLGTYEDRMILIPSETPLTLWHSKPILSNAPVEFSDLFTIRINERGGDPTCTFEMDGKLIIFKAADIFYTAGDGPNSAGTGGSFPEPQRINVDAGCTNARSLVLIPDGLMFQSKKGFYLLDRGLNAQYIGMGVEAYNSETVTSATLISSTNQVRFTLASGICLVYDYFFKQWCTFTNHSAVDATVFRNNFCYLNSTGTVMQETPGSYTDNGSFIKLRAVTGWLSFAGLQAFQRVRRLFLLGEYKSAHQLYVQLAYDFNSAFTFSKLIDVTGTIGPSTYGSDATYGASAVYGGAFPNLIDDMHLSQQKCTSMQISIEDIQSTAFGEGLSLSALSFEVGMKKGHAKLPAAQKVGVSR